MGSFNSEIEILIIKKIIFSDKTTVKIKLCNGQKAVSHKVEEAAKVNMAS